MILAAGEGRRMRPLTREAPKALLEVGGVALIVRLIEALASGGFTEVVVNLFHRGDMIEGTLGRGDTFGVAIAYSRETRLLETGGGILNALPLLGEEPFLVVNADVYTDFDFSGVEQELAPASAGHLVMVENPPHRASGDFAISADGRLSMSGGKLTYAGISVLSPQLFEGVRPGRFPLRDVLIPAIRAGSLTGEHFRGMWIDVGTLGRLEEARRRRET